MSNLAHILSPSNVLLNLTGLDKRQAFEQISVLLAQHSGVDHALVLESLQAREALASTGLGRGVAVPHGRIKGLKAPIAAFVRLVEAIPFESPDDLPVQMMMCLLIPDHVTQQHLEILSEIAEMFSSEDFRTGLMSEPDAHTIHARIVAWKPGRQAA